MIIRNGKNAIFSKHFPSLNRKRKKVTRKKKGKRVVKRVRVFPDATLFDLHEVYLNFQDLTDEETRGGQL